jgi:hypothetical protein
VPDSLYDRDFYTWTQEQARLLRAKGELLPNDAVDWDRVAEEVEDMGKEVARSAASAYARILEHLLKLEHSPARDPRNTWRRSVRAQRTELERLLPDNPGLRPRLDELYADAWRFARREAAAALVEEDGVDSATLPAECPYARARAEDFDWFPPNRHGLS